MDTRRAAVAASTAALLAIAGFTALGSVFDYPQILQEPTADILARYRDHPGAVTAWFLVLMVSAALRAVGGLHRGRIARDPRIAWLGLAAATVQVVGLSRWVLLVPGISADGSAEAQHRFELFHTWLGTVLGETVGYALTAAFTVLVARTIELRWLRLLGYASAGLIATGVLVPLGLHAATLTNFAGYVLWCLWLLALSYVLWTAQTRVVSSAR